MPLSNEYTAFFDSWFKRIDKRLDKVDGQASLHHHRSHTNLGVLYDERSRQIDAVGNPISTGFFETQDKIDELGDVEAKIDDVDSKVTDLDGKLDDLETRIDEKF